MPRSRRSPPASRKSPSNPEGRGALRLVTEGDRPDPLAVICADFLTRYGNPGTKAQHRSHLADLFATTGRTHPRSVTETDLIVWCRGGDRRLANNTVRQRISAARTFFAWCLNEGHTDTNPAARLTDTTSPLRSYRRVYGKQQAPHPGRWLTKDEAFGTLLGSVADGTEVGMRDELLIRFGLLGMRAAELAGLCWANADRLPTIHWTGKGHKPRTTTAGVALVALLGRYRTAYETGIGRPVIGTDPLLCRARSGPRAPVDRRVAWGRPTTRSSVFHLVAKLAADAGLGHVAPHDLRRTAAGILHRSTDESGAHHFDLLDIQKVLGHADPATTMRCYLDPMDTAVYERAASVLD